MKTCVLLIALLLICVVNVSAQLPRPPDPPPPCSCSCFSLLDGAYWSCLLGNGACCQNDAPKGGGDGPAPVNSLSRSLALREPMTGSSKETMLGPKAPSATSGRNCQPPADLGDSTVLLSPARVLQVRAQLRRVIKAEAVAGLDRMLPVSDSLIATPELRAEIRDYVLANLKNSGAAHDKRIRAKVKEDK